ncbi:MAG TPA: sterol desaturase family protein [Jatrophihabitantaceae bacterium]
MTATRTDRTDTTLRAIGIGFLQTPTAILLVLAVLIALSWRTSAGPARWSDAAVVAALAVLRPFAEWTVHKLLLHGRPRRWWGLRFDPLAARAHRAHHAAPRDPRHTLTPPLVVVELIVAAGLGTAWLPTPLNATAAAAILSFALTTEWTHALIHSEYQPRSAWLRRLARHHRLHHHRNERYWFGVSSTAADRILGTAPDSATVPVSSTTRSLVS